MSAKSECMESMGERAYASKQMDKYWPIIQAINLAIIISSQTDKYNYSLNQSLASS